MTKKHFIALANVLIAQRAEILAVNADSKQMQHIRNGRLDQWQRTIGALADYCSAQNPNFDRSVWFEYIRDNSTT